MAPRRSSHRSQHGVISAFPTIPNRPGRHSRHSRSTYRRPFSIQAQCQSYAVSHGRRQRIRQRRTRERIRRDRIGHAQGVVLCPHWVDGRPGEFWWRLC